MKANEKAQDFLGEAIKYQFDNQLVNQLGSQLRSQLVEDLKEKSENQI